MKNNTKKKEKVNIAIADRCILFVILFCAFNQGGFFVGGILITAILALVMCFVFRVKFGREHIVPGAFCLWYLFCSIKNGFSVEYSAKALIPAVVFIFYMLYTQKVQNKPRFKTDFIKISFVFALIAIVLCVGGTISKHTLQKASFPIGYSNVAGIFFGINFLMSLNEKDGFINKAKYIFVVALVLTQSVGALLVTGFMFFAMNIKDKRNWAIPVVVVVFCIVFKDKVYNSMFTFLERILQAQDGILCMIKNPFFGIGPGRWDILKPYYQSGIYSARIIHSGPVQVGASSGIPGLAFLLYIAVCAFRRSFEKDKHAFACALALVFHSFMDVTLSYGVMGMMLAMLLGNREETQDAENKISVPSVVIFGITALFVVTVNIGYLQTVDMQNMIKTRQYPLASEYYENNPLVRQSENGKLEYLKSLYAMQRYDDAMEVMNNTEPKSDDIYLMMAWCSDESILLDAMKLQPHNVKLYNQLLESDNNEIKNEAFRIWGEESKKMSALGKLLYYR